MVSNRNNFEEWFVVLSQEECATTGLFVEALSTSVRWHASFFRDYKAAFGIPWKLVSLCKMTLSNTKCTVFIGKDLTTSFDTKRRFRQGDSLSCDFFNLMIKRTWWWRAADLLNSGTLFYKSFMLLAHEDDIDIIGSGTPALEKESHRLVLVVNENKTKYMLSTVKKAARNGSHVSVDNYVFDVVQEIVYFGISNYYQP